MKPCPKHWFRAAVFPVVLRCCGVSCLAALALACDESESPAKPSAEVASPAPEPTPSAAPVATETKPTPAATTTEAPVGPKTPLNVLLITIDSLRAHMPWTGYERDIAPNLTQLAKESVVYPNAYAASSHTGKSASTILTGRYPSSVYRSGWFFATFADSNLFFTEILQQKGIRTLGGHGHAYFDRGKQLNQGFDVWRVVDGIDFDSETDKHVTSPKMTDMAIEMLSDPANTSGQFFLWYHYMDPHDQYIQHPESPVFGKKARDRYDSEVFFTDLHVGRLLDFAKQQPWWKNTAVIISADHGEAFGEHDMYKHAFELWEVITRVPLIVYAPGAKPRSIEQRRSHIDLAPTILDLMGLGKDPEKIVNQEPGLLVGSSMVPEIYGAPPDVREPIVLDLPEDRNNPERHAIISGDYKLIVKGSTPTPLLFNLAEDPGENKDLAKSNPTKLAEMKKLYDATWENIDVVAPYGGMKLRSGKVADGPTGPTGSEPAEASASKP